MRYDVLVIGSDEAPFVMHLEVVPQIGWRLKTPDGGFRVRDVTLFTIGDGLHQIGAPTLLVEQIPR